MGRNGNERKRDICSSLGRFKSCFIIVVTWWYTHRPDQTLPYYLYFYLKPQLSTGTRTEATKEMKEGEQFVIIPFLSIKGALFKRKIKSVGHKST